MATAWPVLRIAAGTMGLLVLLLTAAVHLVPAIRYEVQVRRRADHDYRAARGTQHLRQLRTSLEALETSIVARRSRIASSRQQLDAARAKRSRELRSTLSRHLAEEQLTDVPGIGSELSARIIAICFRGNLRDLRRADSVPGVGPTRQQAIVRWVSLMERRLPNLLAGDFPGKQQIVTKYSKQELALTERMRQEEKALDRERSLQDKAATAATQLEVVGPSHFREALRKRGPSSPVPPQYLTGVYSPWEPMPDWFEDLLKEHVR